MLIEAKSADIAYAMASIFNEKQREICRLQPIEEIPNKLLWKVPVFYGFKISF